MCTAVPSRELLRFAMRAWLGVALLSVLAGCSKSPEAAHPLPADHAQQVQQWRDNHEADYRRDWVSIAGLFPLKTGANTAGTAPANDIVLAGALPPALGTFVLTEDQVRFEPAPGAAVRIKDQVIAAPVVLKDDSAETPDELLVGDIRLVIHKSGPMRALRVRDPNGPLARQFLGFHWFPIDPRFRVVGRFIKDAQPTSLQVTNTYGDVDTYKSEGVIEFTLNGETLRLRPFTTRPKRFYIVFRDASAGRETYEAARFLYADLLDDGTTVLDFNEAYNPPCAFNPFTTCPLPIPENRLKVKVLAGEQAYPAHVELPVKGPRAGGAGLASAATSVTQQPSLRGRLPRRYGSLIAGHHPTRREREVETVRHAGDHQLPATLRRDATDEVARSRRRGHQAGPPFVRGMEVFIISIAIR